MTFNLNSTTVAVIFGDTEEIPHAGALPAEPASPGTGVPGFSIFARTRRRSPVRAGAAGGETGERRLRRPVRRSGAPRPI